MIAAAAHAGDEDDLVALLHAFLQGVDQASVHERFWAEDLVYTSSRGTRTTKAGIMDGFAANANQRPRDAGLRYAAEAVDVRVYGMTAVVAFRLVATDADGAAQRFFNTGTFVKRDARWQAVAWQATKIQD